MIEKNKKSYFASHIGLILGIIFIFFPVWLTFVASTVTQEDIIKPPFPLLPGPHFFENYYYALFEGTPEGYGKNIPVLKLLFNSAIMALGITFGKNIISLISDLSIV